MMRLSVLAATGAALLQTTQASLYGESKFNHTCAIVTPYLSCSAEAQANVTDSCCAETFGGLVLSTQYWDTYTGFESEGQILPKNTWTLHGLWPDFCNGSYTQYCDLDRQYDPAPSPNTTTGLANGTVVPAYNGSTIDTFLKPFGKYDLLAYMKKYWVSQGGLNSGFWGHEFSKHATCFSSFDLPCYGPKYVEHEEVVDFFETAISYYAKLPTYNYLAAAEIYPSNTTTTSLKSIQSALTRGFGAIPYVGCSGARYNNTEAGKAANSTDSGFTSLSEVWYYYHVFGRVQRGQGVPVDASINGGSVSNCAKAEGAIKYSSRTEGSEA